MANHLIHDKFVGAYVYAITVDGLVRYIGKGRRHRAIEHFRWAREINRRRAKGEKITALPVHNRLAKALRNGAILAYEIIANGMEDAVAYEREREEIAKAPAGQLWNIQPGGCGTDGSHMRKLWSDPVFREKIMKIRQETYSDPEFIERQRQNAVAQWADPEMKARHDKQHRELWDNPQRAAERRALLKKVWSDPEKAARKKELVKSQWTPERRAAMAENRRKAWADPAFKERSAASIRKSKTPEIREKARLQMIDEWAKRKATVE